MRVVIVGPPSLLIADLNLALYLNGAVDSLTGVTSTEHSITATISHYDVANLPDGAQGDTYTLTWLVGGQSGVSRWSHNTDYPSSFILPIRASGVTLADLDVVLWFEGVSVATTDLTLTAVGDDYLLAGIPQGSGYRVVYSYLGVHTVLSQPTPPREASTFSSWLLDSLRSEMGSTIHVQYVTRDQYGDFVPSGAAQYIPCYIMGRNKLVTNRLGTQIVSTVTVNLDGFYDLDEDNHHFTLPSTFRMGTRRAVAIGKYHDEHGPHHEVVYL